MESVQLSTPKIRQCSWPKTSMAALLDILCYKRHLLRAVGCGAVPLGYLCCTEEVGGHQAAQSIQHISHDIRHRVTRPWCFFSTHIYVAARGNGALAGDSLQLLILIFNKRIQVIHDILRELTALGHQVMLEWQLAALRMLKVMQGSFPNGSRYLVMKSWKKSGFLFSSSDKQNLWRWLSKNLNLSISRFKNQSSLVLQYLQFRSLAAQAEFSFKFQVPLRDISQGASIICNLRQS